LVILSKIYTKTGDLGETSLGDGTRVKKSAPRVDSYGNVDELNAILGLAHFHATHPLKDMIQAIQNDLFDLGADLCVPLDGSASPNEKPKPESALRMVEKQVLRLEREIDEVNQKLDPLRSFILPGGTLVASFLHQARTVCRRAERSVIALQEVEAINPFSVQYLNRLSDWLFVMARNANEHGKSDILWVPGAHRKK